MTGRISQTQVSFFTSYISKVVTETALEDVISKKAKHGKLIVQKDR